MSQKITIISDKRKLILNFTKDEFDAIISESKHCPEFKSEWVSYSYTNLHEFIINDASLNKRLSERLPDEGLPQKKKKKWIPNRCCTYFFHKPTGCTNKNCTFSHDFNLFYEQSMKTNNFEVIEHMVQFIGQYYPYLSREQILNREFSRQ